MYSVLCSTERCSSFITNSLGILARTFRVNLVRRVLHTTHFFLSSLCSRLPTCAEHAIQRLNDGRRRTRFFLWLPPTLLKRAHSYNPTGQMYHDYFCSYPTTPPCPRPLLAASLLVRVPPPLRCSHHDEPPTLSRELDPLVLLNLLVASSLSYLKSRLQE